MDLTKRFARHLSEQREQNGLTPAELAQSASMPLPQLEAIESGTEQPELETLVKLAGSLGMPIGDLLADVTWQPGEGFKTSGPR